MERKEGKDSHALRTVWIHEQKILVFDKERQKVEWREDGGLYMHGVQMEEDE